MELTDELFDRLCKQGRQQRELTAGEDMVPILLLFLPDNTAQILGLVGPSEAWIPGLAKVGEEFKPTAAALTADIFLTITDDPNKVDVRPREDAAAVNALVVMDSAGRSRVMTYSIKDNGRFEWNDEAEAVDQFGPAHDAIRNMVRRDDG